MPTEKLLRRSELSLRLNVKDSAINRMVKIGKLPKPIRLNAHDFRWIEQEVDAAIEKLKEGR